jgi:hypothetical protein
MDTGGATDDGWLYSQKKSWLLVVRRLIYCDAGSVRRGIVPRGLLRCRLVNGSMVFAPFFLNQHWMRQEGKQDQSAECVRRNPVPSAMPTPKDPFAVRVKVDQCSRQMKRVERHEI